MENLRLSAWRFCGAIKKYADKNPTLVMYSISRKITFDRKDIYKKYFSEITGHEAAAKLNTNSVTLLFKLELIETYAYEIDRRDVRRFFHYLEESGYIKFYKKLGNSYHFSPEEEDAFGATGFEDGTKYDSHMAVALTPKGIDFADTNFVSLILDEFNVSIAVMALVVSFISIIIA